MGLQDKQQSLWNRYFSAIKLFETFQYMSQTLQEHDNDPYVFLIKMRVQQLHYFLMQVHNNLMQIKQLKSIINANYFTPWSIDPDIEDIITSTANRESLESPKFKKYVDPLNASSFKEKKNIQEQAKKTLLNIDDNLRNKKVADLKSYARNRKKTPQSIFPQGISQLKLPPINGLVDFSNCYVLESEIKPSNLSSIDDSFRKLGEFKGRGRPGAVGRTLSDVSTISKEMSQINDLRKKFQTIDIVPHAKSRSQVEMKSIKLKGKKFSLDLREHSERMQIDRGSYIPTHPNITPHHLLLGHNQGDVLKRVLHQLNYKVK